jgi:protein ImuA
MSPTARAELLSELKNRIRQIERSHRSAKEAAVTPGTALDCLLPGQGLARGTLVEWLSEGEGTGAATLALAVAAPLLEDGGALVVIDGRHEFYPPAAAGLGIPLERTVIVRPERARDVLWAWEQSLRSSAVTVAMSWIEKLDDRTFRRLQLAAEAGGSLGFLLRPASCRTEPSWAEARLLVEAMPALRPDKVARRQGDKVVSPLHPVTLSSCARRLRVEVLHCRGGAGGAAVELEMSDETGDVRLVSELAHPASPSRTAGAS